MGSDIEKQNEMGEQIRDVPLCLKCARPVDAMSHYCPHCGETTGQMTPYIPFVNLRMQINFYAQMWRQIWFGRISFTGRVFRLLMIVLLMPILLLALPAALWEKFRAKSR
jgi:hypothetical protein